MISLILCNLSFGQKAPKKYETAVIRTSSQCGDCKKRIEDGLNYTKGIKFAELNLEENTVSVKYQVSKITLEGVKKALNAIGYDADELKAPEEAVKKLPACCQPGGMEK